MILQNGQLRYLFFIGIFTVTLVVVVYIINLNIIDLEGDSKIIAIIQTLTITAALLVGLIVMIFNKFLDTLEKVEDYKPIEDDRKNKRYNQLKTEKAEKMKIGTRESLNEIPRIEEGIKKNM